jgi:GLPGLI family protein
MFLNFNSYDEYFSELLFNNNESYFAYKRKELINQDVNDAQKFSFRVGDSSALYIKSKLIENSVSELVKGIRDNKFLIVEENIPKINWEISDSTKIVNAYQCFKATGYFAGRNYIVWFTPELPNLFGPWKLHGLPGSILEATDLTQEVRFVCTKIESISKPINNEEDTPYERITKEQYKADLKEFMNNFGKNLSTKMGRGITVKVETTGFKSIEMYEN